MRKILSEQEGPEWEEKTNYSFCSFHLSIIHLDKTIGIGFRTEECSNCL